MVLIKFEKEIDDCRGCPFHKEIKMGNPCDNIGIWFESYCNKIGKIKQHDCDNYQDDYKYEIPDNCPFKK